MSGNIRWIFEREKYISVNGVPVLIETYTVPTQNLTPESIREFKSKRQTPRLDGFYFHCVRRSEDKDGFTTMTAIYRQNDGKPIQAFI